MPGLKAVVAVTMLLAATPGAVRADVGSNVTCKATVVAVNVVPNRRVQDVALVYGYDEAFAMVQCVSLTRDSYRLWVSLTILDSSVSVLAHRDGSPNESLQGLGSAGVETVARGYDEPVVDTPRMHYAVAQAWIQCTAGCAPELKEVVVIEYPA